MSTSASETSSNWDEPASTCSLTKSIADYLLAEYTTVQRVVVRSPRLRIPELILTSVVVIFNIMYVQIYKLQCFARKEIHPSPLISVVPALTHSSCEERYVDCTHQIIDVEDTVTFPYCEGNRTLNVSGCMPFYGRFGRGGMSQFIATMGSKIHQERDQIGMPWRSTKITRLYVAGTEDARVELTHGFSGNGWLRSEMVGILRSHNGSECQLPCKGCDLPSLAPDCTQKGLVYEPWADYIPLHVILDAAGLNLDKLMPHTIHTAPLRYWGSCLALRIDYSDDDHVDFWFRGAVGRVPKFVVHPHMLPQQGANQYYDIVEPSWLEDPGSKTERDILKNSGILMLDLAQGERIIFDVSFIVMSIVVSLGSLKVAKLVVDSILVRVYSCCPGWELTYVLYQHYTQRTTPDESRVAQLLTTSDTPDQRARLLRNASKQAEEESLHQAMGVRGCQPS